jgi:hypothetical protein
VFALSGRGLCDGPIPHPEESYRLWCVSECDQVQIKTRYTCREKVGRRRKDYERIRHYFTAFFRHKQALNWKNVGEWRTNYSFIIRAYEGIQQEERRL